MALTGTIVNASRVVVKIASRESKSLYSSSLMPAPPKHMLFVE